VNHPPEPQPAAPQVHPDLSAAYTELQNLLLDEPDVAEFLHQLATLSAARVPGASCGLMMRRDHQVLTVTSNDDFARTVDEIQHGRGQGPCLQALHTGRRVDVPVMAGEARWADYCIEALAAGVGSSISLPLTVNGDTIGALNLYSRSPNAFRTSTVRMLESFTRQAATALALMLRHAQQQQLHDEMAEGLATRAAIDQALGIVMAQRKITSTDAFAVLREASQRSNRKLSDIAADLIQAVTGHPPQPPRPFTYRD
jgi:GAF domain-containing protein